MAGTALQALRQATQNLRKTEESIPSLKEVVSTSRWRSIRRLVIVIVFVVVLAVALAR
jgi:hypothetical protein